MLIPLRESKSGVLLPVRVKPRAKASAVGGVRDEKLLVAVTAAPTDGEANAAVLSVLAKTLDITPGALSIARGSKTRDKTICIAALSVEEVHTRLTAALPSDKLPAELP